MSIEDFEKIKELLLMRSRVLVAENARLSGSKTHSLEEIDESLADYPYTGVPAKDDLLRKLGYIELYSGRFVVIYRAKLQYEKFLFIKLQIY